MHSCWRRFQSDTHHREVRKKRCIFLSAAFEKQPLQLHRKEMRFLHSCKDAKGSSSDRFLFSSWAINGMQNALPIDRVNTCPISGALCTSVPIESTKFIPLFAV